MKAKSAFEKVRDQRTGDAPSDREFRLMCKAHGCPMRWTVSFGGEGGLCSAHAWAREKESWPEITQQLCWDETERARLRGEPEPFVEHVTHAEKREILHRLRNVFEPRDPKAWIAVLEAKVERGEKLSAMQAHCLREARKPHGSEA